MLRMQASEVAVGNGQAQVPSVSRMTVAPAPSHASATATRLYFSQGQPEPVRAIQRTVTGKTSGTDAEQVGTEVRGLPPLTCLLANRQHEPYVRVSVEPYFQRIAE